MSVPAGCVRAPKSALKTQRPGRSAIAFYDQPLYQGETTEAGPLWPFGNFAAVKDMGSCSPPFMAEIARALGERYEPA